MAISEIINRRWGSHEAIARKIIIVRVVEALAYAIICALAIYALATGTLLSTGSSCALIALAVVSLLTAFLIKQRRDASLNAGAAHLRQVDAPVLLADQNDALEAKILALEADNADKSLELSQISAAVAEKNARLRECQTTIQGLYEQNQHSEALNKEYGEIVHRLLTEKGLLTEEVSKLRRRLEKQENDFQMEREVHNLAKEAVHDEMNKLQLEFSARQEELQKRIDQHLQAQADDLPPAPPNYTALSFEDLPPAVHGYTPVSEEKSYIEKRKDALLASLKKGGNREDLQEADVLLLDYLDSKYPRRRYKKWLVKELTESGHLHNEICDLSVARFLFYFFKFETLIGGTDLYNTREELAAELGLPKYGRCYSFRQWNDNHGYWEPKMLQGKWVLGMYVV